MERFSIVHEPVDASHSTVVIVEMDKPATIMVGGRLSYLNITDSTPRRASRSGLTTTSSVHSDNESGSSLETLEGNTSLDGIDRYGRIGRLMRPYLSMASREVFTSSVYKLKPDSLLLWTEDAVVRPLLLALRGVESVIFKYESLPPTIMVAGLSISTMTTVLREAHVVYTQRVLVSAAVDALSSATDSAQLALAATVRELLFIFDTTLMHVEMECDKTCASLIGVWWRTRLYRLLLRQLLALLDSRLASSLQSGTFAASTEYTTYSYWMRNTLTSWELLEVIFGLLNTARHLMHQPYKRSISWPLVAGTRVMDEGFMRTAVLAHVVHAVSKPLLIDLQETVFRLSLNQALVQDISATLLLTVSEICASYNGRPIGLLRALLAWAAGRVQLLRIGALGGSDGVASVENAALVSFCRDSTADILRIPLQEGQLADVLDLCDRARLRSVELQRQVETRLMLWHVDGVGHTLGMMTSPNNINCPLRSFSTSMPPSTFSSMTSFVSALADVSASVLSTTPVATELAPSIVTGAVGNTERDTSANADMKEVIDEDVERFMDIEKESKGQFLLSSGAITSRWVERYLFEEAHNDILTRHLAKMRELETRAALVRWQQQRLLSVELSRDNLRTLYTAEAADWTSRSHSEAVLVNLKSVFDEVGVDANKSLLVEAVESVKPEKSDARHDSDDGDGLASSIPQVVSIGITSSEIVSLKLDHTYSQGTVTDNSANRDIEAQTLENASSHIQSHPDISPPLPLSLRGQDAVHEEHLPLTGNEISSVLIHRPHPTTPGLDSSFALSYTEQAITSPSCRDSSLVLDPEDDNQDLSMNLSHPESDNPVPSDVHVAEENYDYSSGVGSTDPPKARFVQPSSASAIAASPFLEGEMARAAGLLLSPDVYDLEGDHALLRGLDTLEKAFHVVALKSGISTDATLGKHNDCDKMSLPESEDLSSLLRRSLCLAVSTQCRMLDQAVILTAIREGALLNHLNRVDDMFLVSPRACRAAAVVGVIIDSYLERGGGRPRRMVWSTRTLETAAKQVLALQSHIDGGGEGMDFFAAYKLDHLLLVEQSVHSLFDVFSSNELHCLQTEYLAPWPLSFIFSADSLIGVAKCSRRLFHLSQAAHLGNVLWTEVKDMRGREARQERISIGMSGRHLHEVLYRTNRVVRGLFEAFGDRVLAAQIEFRERMVSTSIEGFGQMICLFREYSYRLVTYTFAEDAFTISRGIRGLLDACLLLFQTMRKGILASIVDTGDLLLCSQDVETQKQRVVAALRSCSRQQQIHAKIFLTVLDEM